MDKSLATLSVIQLTQKERPIDRYLSSQVISLEHNNRTATLFCVVEILNQWHPAREIGATLPQTFIRLFGRSNHHSLLTKFEDTLKNLNKNLETASEKVLTDVSCAFLLACDQDVYFSAIGSAQVLLLRNNKLSLVGGQAKTAKQESYFGTVTSGELSTEDWLFIANDQMAQLLHQIGPEELFEASADATEFWHQAAAQIPAGTVAGACIRLASDQAGLEVLYLDQLDSRVPISLPKLSLPHFSLTNSQTALQRSLDWLKNNFAKLTKLRQFNWPSFRNYRFTKKNLAIAAVIGAVILSLIGWQVHSKKTTAAPNVTANPLVTDFSTDQLRSFFQKDLTESNYQKLSTTQQDFLKTAAVADKTTIVPLPSAVSELPNPIVALDAIGDSTTSLILLDSTGQLWQQSNGSVSQLTQNRPIAQPRSLTAFSATKIVVTDNNGNVFLVNSGQVSALALPTKLAIGPKLVARFGANLYLYNQTDSQIYRVTNFTDNLTGATAYLSGATVPNLSDWMINGDIFTVTTDGKIQDWQRGKLTSTQFEAEIPAGTTRIDKNSTDSVVVTSGRYLDIYNASGQRTNSLAIVSNDPITDIFQTNNGWLLAIGSKLYFVTAS